MAKDDDTSPWLKGVPGVRGIVPPGRRLGPKTDRRPNRWSASGVKGVVPPGSLQAGEGPGVDWAKSRAKAQALAQKKNQRALADAERASARDKPATKVDAEIDMMRPMAGFVPEAFADVGDPDDLKAFLQRINDFLAEHVPDPGCAEHYHQLVTQSHAPFEIVVGFTVLSSVVGRSSELRRRYSLSLERGAKVFFNLAARLNDQVKAPRGLVPETVDAIFYDLPATAYQMPYAFATDAFVQQLELLRQPDHDDLDQALLGLAEELRGRFIERRSFGDQPLADLFPWQPPDWGPPDF